MQEVSNTLITAKVYQLLFTDCGVLSGQYSDFRSRNPRRNG